MYPVIDDSPHFHRLLAGRSDADLATVACEVARDAYPDLNERRSLTRLDDLAERVRAKLEPSSEPWLMLTAIGRVLFEECGFHGNDADFYDPRNSYLNEVLERRTGIPVSLGLIFMVVADRVGLKVSGVNLPGHFVVRTEIDGATIFLDPYNEGRVVDVTDMTSLVQQALRQKIEISPKQLQPCSSVDVVARVLQNLKLIYVRARKFEAAIPVLKRLALIHRDAPEELRDLGILCFYDHRRRESLEYLREYLKAAPTADDANDIRSLLRSANSL